MRWGSSFVCASFQRPPRHQRPKPEVPPTHAPNPSDVHSIRSSRLQNTLSRHALAHALITHASLLPTVTAKQCPPLPSRSSTLPLPPQPSPHFTSPPTSSAPLPFFFVVGSSDRGIPSLLTPLMGWCAQMKTMYFFPNGSAQLPHFPANCSSGIEVKLFRVTAGSGSLAAAAAAAQVAPAPGSLAALGPLLPSPGFFSHSLPLSCPTKTLLTVAQKLHAASALKNGRGARGAAEKEEFLKTPRTALETFTC